MSRRAVRLLFVPKSEAKIDTIVTLSGDPVRGRQLFAASCASCHGEGGQGGSVGPTLVGREVSIGAARATIENGSGVMPAGLVTGQDLEDVLAYLQTLLSR